jgi:TolA-binding protein
MIASACQVGETEKAKMIIFMLTKRDPAYKTNPRIMVLWSWIYRVNKNYDTALAMIEHDQSDEGLWSRGLIYRDAKQYDKALAELTKHQTAFPQSIHARERLMIQGEVLYEAEKYTAARDAFNGYITHFPEDIKEAYCRYMIAGTYLLEAKYHEAYQGFKRAAVQEFDPLLADRARLLQAESASMMGNRIEAKQLYKTLARITKDAALKKEALYRLGGTDSKKNTSELTAFYQKSIALVRADHFTLTMPFISESETAPHAVIVQ